MQKVKYDILFPIGKNSGLNRQALTAKRQIDKKDIGDSAHAPILSERDNDEAVAEHASDKDERIADDAHEIALDHRLRLSAARRRGRSRSQVCRRIDVHCVEQLPVVGQIGEECGKRAAAM